MQSFQFLDKMAADNEATRSRTAKTQLLKKLNDFRSLNPNRTAIIRLERQDVARLIELTSDRNPAIARKLEACKHEWESQITLMANEVDFLVKEVEHS
ncbi:hypothetical protein H6F89_28720 [Cyanobacteria bacterium FACHB-63]|nr:hypothetical protein [Cyanobacteria bacterium FACHB-63]